MSFPDNARLVKTPREFAKAVLVGGAVGDLGPEISNLLGFTKGFYLQYFQEEFATEISRLDLAGIQQVRSIEQRLLRDGGDEASRLLVSHYITISSALDGSTDNSGDVDLSLGYEEVLFAVEELLSRVAVWARGKSLSALAREADMTHEEFSDALARILPL